MIKKILLLFIWIILLTVNLFATKLQGQARIDSLKTALQKETVDTNKVFQMAQISISYSKINPEEGLKYGTDALELATKIKWEKGIGNALYFRGANFLGTSKFPEALEDYLGALKYFEKSADSAKMAGTLSNIGNIYGYQSKNDKALEYFLKALAINRIIHPKGNFEAAILGNIGVIYYGNKEFTKALDYNLQAMKICEDGKFMDMLPNAYISVGGIYIELKEYIKALYYSQKAMTLAKQVDDLPVIANSYAYIGTAILRIVMEENKHLIDSLYKGNKQAALADAKTNLDSAVNISYQVDDQVRISEAYKNLVDLEEYNGNFKAALEDHKLFKAINDSVFNSDKNEKILQTSMEYDFEKKEAATKAEQEKRELQQRNIRNSITAGLAGALFFLVVVYRQRNKIKAGKKRSDELLLNILPSEVAEELKAKGSADAKQFDEVTVMFTDFKDFTQISEKLSPTELVNEIHNCFKAFDDIICKHNIEKIKTIGDSYMCAGGLPVANKTHAEDVVKAALEIQEYMNSRAAGAGGRGSMQSLSNLPTATAAAGMSLDWQLRIGIHTGTVVAGIVGVKKFAYDIWGDTVNIASRMESSGEAGKVNISGATYALVKEKFYCIHRGKIEAKNKGEIDMYFLDRSIKK